MGWQQRHKVVPAVYIVFRRGDEVLLLQRANTGYRDGEYSLPSGHFDGGESAVQAAVREAKEETGVDIDPKDLTLEHTQHRLAEEGDHERVDMYFEASQWRGEPKNAEPEKCSDLRWCRLQALPPNILPELRRFLKSYAANERYSDLGF